MLMLPGIEGEHSPILRVVPVSVFQDFRHHRDHGRLADAPGCMHVDSEIIGASVGFQPLNQFDQLMGERATSETVLRGGAFAIGRSTVGDLPSH